MATDRLRILHVASEAAPLVKTGGLADVAGALPKALCAIGHDARVAIPGYRSALRAAERHGITWGHDPLVIEAGGVDHRIGVGTVVLDGLTFHILACNELFDRDGIYGPGAGIDYDDNPRRFAVFSKASLALSGYLRWTPHVIHAHDWQAGLVPALRERGFGRVLPATRTVFSIHNIAYQGACEGDAMRLAGFDPWLYNPMHLEHFGRFNPLKAGIVFADRVTAVSRTYAQEIQTQEFGYTLDAVARHHAYKLDGIVNGIDTLEWDPATDPHLPAHFDAANLAGKAACTAALRRECGLADHPGSCVVGVVSRLVEQKGIDLILATVEPYILAGRMQLIVLGSGDLALEHRLHHLASRHPGWVYAWYGYNEGLAHRIIAGSDALLVPSRYEPCGLTQLYAKRYGTLPIVRHTGGLADTVTDVAVGPGAGNGFTFGPVDLGHFSSVLDRALGLYQHFPQEWKAAQLRAMADDHSWHGVARQYEDVYRSLSFAGAREDKALTKPYAMVTAKKRG